MAAYPSSVKSFTTKSSADTIQAAHINDLQDEVTAVENDLITGLPIGRGGTGLTSLAANRIPYSSGSAFTSASGFTFDGTTLTLPGQIAFPATQSASSGVNTLDDYEEGTWTPTIGGSGGQSGQVYSVQVGSYIKIGKLVLASFRVTLSTLGTITTAAQIQGLPFTSENTTNQTASLCVGNWTAFTTAAMYVTGLLTANTTAITLLFTPAAGVNISNVVQADLSNTTSIDGTILYRASA